MDISVEKFPSPYGEVTFVKLTNAGGAWVRLSSIGAGVDSVVVPDRNGRLADVALGYESPADYFYDGPCAGKVPGRYANRIANGRFTLDGHEYNLPINNGPNCNHGGPEGFQNKVWGVEIVGDSAVRFTLHSEDGDSGFPANLEVVAEYTWTDDNRLTLRLHAESDAKTVVNLTNHTYWNLDGEGSGPVTDHLLRLNADLYFPTDPTLVPTGERASVASTPMDFREAKPFGRDMRVDFAALEYGKGYDACWEIKGVADGSLRFAAELISEKSGRSLRVETTQPGVQVYGGNWLSGCPTGKNGHVYNDYDGIAIECQGIPDSPNKPQFPSQVVEPGRPYDQVIAFAFGVI